MVILVSMINNFQTFQSIYSSMKQHKIISHSQSCILWYTHPFNLLLHTSQYQTFNLRVLKLNFLPIILISTFQLLVNSKFYTSLMKVRCKIHKKILLFFCEKKSAAGRNLHLFVETSAYFMYIIFHQHSQKKAPLTLTFFCWSEPFSLIIFHFSFSTFFTIDRETQYTKKILFLFLLMISIC